MTYAATKACFKCGEEKPRAEFYAHPKMGDGLLGKCKECTKTDARRWRKLTLPERQQYDRERYRDDPKRKESMRAVAKRAAAIHPEKKAARYAVSNAVRDGRLIRKPCEACGVKKVHAHHPDYSKPLDVRWLCVRHHWEEHTIF